MFIGLKKLNESLENKYESFELNEKFGDMPDWLSKRILTTKYNIHDGQGRRNVGLHKTTGHWGATTDDIEKKDPKAGPRASYANARGAIGDQSLFGQLLAHGINMDSVNIIEGDKPEKRTDSRLKEPNIPIFLFRNGQVYAKGINDNEEYSGDGSYKAFKYLPMKLLLSDEVEKFAYIDGNDDSNFKVNVKRANRKATKSELAGIKNYYRNKERAGTENWHSKWDKSGYEVIPSPERYKNKLAELKCNKIYDILDDKYQLLEETKEELSNVLLNTDIRYANNGNNSDYDYVFRSYDNLFEQFNTAIRAYNSVTAQIDRVVNSEKYSEEEKKQRLIEIINYDSDYERLMEATSNIEKNGPKVFNSIIDWI